MAVWLDVHQLNRLIRLLFMPVRTALRRRSDLAPAGHFKAIHRQGLVARAAVAWEPWVQARFSGIFASGADEALLRLSWAVEPTKGARVAGLALKCFRDGLPSGNLLAMWSILQSQSSANMLEKPLCTHIAMPTSGRNEGREGARSWRGARFGKLDAL